MRRGMLAQRMAIVQMGPPEQLVALGGHQPTQRYRLLCVHLGTAVAMQARHARVLAVALPTEWALFVVGVPLVTSKAC